MIQPEQLPTALQLKEQGNALVKERRYKEALQKYEEAINFDPLLAPAWLNKGIMHVNLQQYSDALLAFAKTLEIDPNYTKAKDKHAAVQFYLEKNYTKAIEADSNFASAWLAKGILHKKHKQYTDALAAFEKVLALSPDYVEAKSNQIEIFLLQKRYDEIITLDSNCALAWLGKGLMHKNLKQYPEAMIALTKAAELNPAFARNVKFNQAQILIAQQEYLPAWPLLSSLSRSSKPDIQVIESQYESAQQIQAKVVFACVDLKFTADNKIKILEFGRGFQSGFQGLTIATGDDITALLSKKIEELSLLPVVLNSDPGVEVVNHDCIEQLLSALPSSDKKFSPENLATYQAIYGGSEVRALEQESILIMDDTTVNTIFEDKVLTHEAFAATNLEENRPRTMIFERKCHPDLARRIRQSIPGNTFVLKSPDAEGGEGVIIIEDKDLDITLQCLIYEGTDESLTNPNLQQVRNFRITSLLTPLKYSKQRIEEVQLIADAWNNSNKDYFLVEEYVESKPVLYKGNHYDATMRVAFIFIRDEAKTRCEPFACYWKVPPAPIKSVQSLRERTVSSYSVGRHDSARVDEEDEKQVYQQLKIAIPPIIDYMIKKNLLSYINARPLACRHQLLAHFANSLAHQGQFVLAHHYSRQVEQLKPTWWKVSHDRGVFYYLEGKYDKALECFEQVLSISPNPMTFYRRAKTWLALGNRANAKADFIISGCINRPATQMFFQQEQQPEESAERQSRARLC